MAFCHFRRPIAQSRRNRIALAEKFLLDAPSLEPIGLVTQDSGDYAEPGPIGQNSEDFMSIAKNFIAAAITACLPLWAGLVDVNAGPIIYATAGTGSKLVKIDVATRTVTQIGSFGVPVCDAIAINAQGQAYTVSQAFPAGGNNPQLAQVDLATGRATPFGVNLHPESFMGLGFAPDGTLYGINASSGTTNQNSLYRFNVNTGEATKVGASGVNIMDLAWHPDGTMYGAVNDSLYRIDVATGKATLVTKLQRLSRVMGLAIDEGGNFYMSEIVANAALYQLNPVTGATTKLFSTGAGADFPHGLDIRPVPQLTAALVNHQIVLSWPAGWAADFVLQATDSLGPVPAWAAWAGAPTVIGDRQSLEMNAAAPARFFRLIRR